MVIWSKKKKTDLDNWNGIINKNGYAELRRSFTGDGCSAQVLIIVKCGGNTRLSMNGTAPMTVDQIVEMSEAVVEAQDIAIYDMTEGAREDE